MEWQYGPLNIFNVDGHFYRWSYHRLLRSNPRWIARFKLYRGHMPYGLHRFLDAPSTYMTLLREPVDRVISEYYFRRSHPFRHPQEYRTLHANDLYEYVKTTPRRNVQTSLIAGIYTEYDFLNSHCDAATLELAKRNLADHFSFVGITERFAEAVALCSITYGWHVRWHTNFNVGTPRAGDPRSSPMLREMVEEYHQYDCELYRYANGLFEAQLGAKATEIKDYIEAAQNAPRMSPLQLAAYRTSSQVLKAVSRIQAAAILIPQIRKTEVYNDATH